jgi:aminoglycoside phosphotransferase (APT) family kinase protein
MFDPNKKRGKIENYLSKILGYQVKIVQTTKLTKSTREEPWKIIVEADGIEKSYVLQVDPKTIDYEYQVLKAMEHIQIPTPVAYALDMTGKEIGVPCYFCDFIEGETLLGSMLSGAKWAETLYIESVCELQSVTEEELGDFAKKLKCETAADVLKDAYSDLKKQSLPLAEKAYQKLKKKMPELPPVKFSNGDLWLENFIVKDQKLAGVIDFPNATFSDPIFEFLLTFFVSPELQGRGIEDRFCRKLGYDPSILHWYHGLEYFDTWRWVLKTGESFVHHTATSLERDLRKWLDDG